MKRDGWRNRIVESGVKPASDFLAHHLQWRVHPKAQQEALGEALDRVGWVQNVVESARSGYLLDGHARVALALRRGEDEPVPYVAVDVTEEEEALVLATLDPLGAMAAADRDKLDELLAQVEAGEGAVAEMLAELAQKSGLDWGKPVAGEDPGPELDRAAELQERWQTARGQLWELPSLTVPGKAHRLLCGDGAQVDDAGRLYRDGQVSLVWTDPPYGVSYGEKNRYLQSIGRADRLLGDIEGDQAEPGEVRRLVAEALSRVAEAAMPRAVAYVAAPPGPLHVEFIRAMNESGFQYRHQLIWLKNQLVFGRSDYMYKHEPILYGWLQNGAHYFEPVTNNCTVFEFPRPRASKLHPTEKPVELVGAMVENSSRKGDLVADPFLGSGTTMAAAEGLGRICYGCDIDPGYVAVTLQRMQGMGLEPRRADG